MFSLARRSAILLMVVLLAPLAACNLSSGDSPSEVTLTVTPAGTWISLLAPEAGATVERGGALELRARIENASDEIERAEIRIDDEIIQRFLLPNPGGASSVMIQEEWLAAASGEHVMRVYVCFADGRCIESAPLVFSVVLPPTEIVPTDPPTNADPAATRRQPIFTTATREPSPTTAAAIAVIARILAEALNVRTGPSTLFEPVSTLQRDEEVRVFARTEDGWYKLFLAGEERWIYGAESAGLVEFAGPHLSLPIDPGPPPPTRPPATATPIPPQFPNLVIIDAELAGGSLTCGEAGLLRFRVQNTGVAPTQWGGTIQVHDVLVSSQEIREIQAPNFGILAAGETTPWFSLSPFVDTHYGEKHAIEIVLDPNQKIVESNELDNRWNFVYTLQQGNCP